MDNFDYERRMRALEYYHGLRVVPASWFVLRVDGRSFSRFTATRYEKPFDATLHALMLRTAEALLTELHGVYAYTESDEISVLFAPQYDLFDREVEKLVSISAGIASATFTLAAQASVHFDSRVWLGPTEEQVIDYMRWRQADAERGGLHSWCYWTLRTAGRTAAEATAALDGASIADKNELLFQHGINFNDLPVWQRRGSGLYWETYAKAGYDPVHDLQVSAARRRLVVNEELPMKDAYSAFIRDILVTAVLHDDTEGG